MIAVENTVLIVDDEPPARQRLEQLVDELPGWRVCGVCASGEDALERIFALQPEVVLLDIRMPGMGGLEAAKHLSVLAEPPAVVFTTAYDEYALAAFESHAVGYLLKPIRRERLADALARAARLSPRSVDALRGGHQHAARRSHIAVRVRDQLRLIPLKDIRFFRAEQKYVTIVHERGEDLSDEALKDLADEFAEEFVRVHRSYVVATRAVDTLERDERGHWWLSLRGRDGLRLPVSRRQVTDLKRRLGAATVLGSKAIG